MVQLEELLAEQSSPPPPPPAVSALHENITSKKSSSSSYYYAHHDRNTGDDIPAPPPPEGGTKLPNKADAKVSGGGGSGGEKSPAGGATPDRGGDRGGSAPNLYKKPSAIESSPYYTALHRRPSQVTEDPAPMPPDGKAQRHTAMGSSDAMCLPFAIHTSFTNLYWVSWLTIRSRFDKKMQWCR